MVGQCTGLARSGLVQTGQAGGHFEMLQVCCWSAGGPRRLSHACHKSVRNVVGRREMR